MNPIRPEWLEILRAFKKRMPRKDSAENVSPCNVSPFDDRITTVHGNVLGFDLSDIHAEIRERIEHTVETVRDGKTKSQVILLAGDVGAGKTHLLRSFQSPEITKQLGHIFVGGANHWTIKEFQAQLLDWMLEALTSPSPSNDDHLLLGRVREIGFHAAQHLLANPGWKQCLSRRRGRLLGRLFGWLWTPSYEKLKQMVTARDPAVFRLLDFTRFSEYVCDRFLANKSNPTQRYVMRVLLTYLFPDRQETGIGTRERVLHWFRDRADNSYFTRRLGAAERLDRHYCQSEAVKLLVHLFSPAVSQDLSTEQHQCVPRAFLFVFDQIEGLNELFDSIEDWKDFFAHLSELYNTLPNVVVLFTMTLSMRNHLHSVMERQFRDRIRMDENYMLRLPTQEQVCDLYRSRVEHWLRDDPIVLDLYRGLEGQLIPFERDELLAIAGQQSIRETLADFDKHFHDKMRVLILEPDIDYNFYLNEIRSEEDETPNFSYVAGHLQRLRELLNKAGSWLATDYQLVLDKVEEVPDAAPEAILLTFSDPSQPDKWVCTYIARLSHNSVQAQIDDATKLLFYKEKARYTLWLARFGGVGGFELKRPDQSFGISLDKSSECNVKKSSESRLRALLHLIEKQEGYQQDGHWLAAQDLIRREVTGSYLGELFRESRSRLNKVLAGTPQDQPEVIEEPAQAEH